ncbi:MAG TPA: hypothetical protein VK509_18795 [Polyangiales bacterium]|nr:hypothetical protein [Polyangiales bacterium]
MSEPKNPPPITRARFEQLLEAYGAEPARWPEPERGPARALLARDPEAQRALREAAAFDRLLDDGSVALEPSAALRRAVAEIPLRAPPVVAAPWLLASFARSALAAALVLALGVLAGVATAADEPASADASGTAVATSGSDEQSAGAADEDSLDALVELAFNDGLDEEQTP